MNEESILSTISLLNSSSENDVSEALIDINEYILYPRTASLLISLLKSHKLIGNEELSLSIILRSFQQVLAHYDYESQEIQDLIEFLSSNDSFLKYPTFSALFNEVFIIFKEFWQPTSYAAAYALISSPNSENQSYAINLAQKYLYSSRYLLFFKYYLLNIEDPDPQSQEIFEKHLVELINGSCLTDDELLSLFTKYQLANIDNRSLLTAIYNNTGVLIPFLELTSSYSFTLSDIILFQRYVQHFNLYEDSTTTIFIRKLYSDLFSVYDYLKSSKVDEYQLINFLQSIYISSASMKGLDLLLAISRKYADLELLFWTRYISSASLPADAHLFPMQEIYKALKETELQNLSILNSDSLQAMLQYFSASDLSNPTLVRNLDKLLTNCGMWPYFWQTYGSSLTRISQLLFISQPSYLENDYDLYESYFIALISALKLSHDSVLYSHILDLNFDILPPVLINRLVTWSLEHLYDDNLVEYNFKSLFKATIYIDSSNAKIILRGFSTPLIIYHLRNHSSAEVIDLLQHCIAVTDHTKDISSFSYIINQLP